MDIFKIRNIIIVKKSSNKDKYKEIVKDSKKDKTSKLLFRISILLLIFFGIYLGFGILLGIFMVLLVFITLGGTMYVDTGTDSTFFNNIMGFSSSYFGLLEYTLYFIYLLVFIVLIRLIYINILNYKVLKSNSKTL